MLDENIKSKILDLSELLVDDSYDYLKLIEKAYELTEGVLMVEIYIFENKKGQDTINITYKNQITKFVIQDLNSEFDTARFVKELNKALISVFYVGDFKFFDVSGTIYEKAIGFISKPQYKQLTNLPPIEKPVNLEALEKNQLEQEEVDVKLEQKSDFDQNDSFPNQLEEQEYKDLLDKMKTLHELNIRNILLANEKYSKSELYISKRLAKEQCNIGNLYYFGDLINRKDIFTEDDSRFIKDVVEMLKYGVSIDNINQELTEKGLGFAEKDYIIKEAQDEYKSIRSDEQRKVWKIVIFVVLIILKLFLYLIR